MNYYHSVSELVGKTPLLRLSHIEKENELQVTLLAKLECMNPAGSVKDRVALSMITDAEESGRLSPGGTIIEPTSGNTGIGLSALAAAKGYRVIITMPDTMSVERQRLMKAYGAEVILTDGKLGMNGAIAKAEELAKEIDGAIVAGQFVSPANPRAHYTTTGPEIWADTDGTVDVFVAGAGTGGTVTGTGRYLKEQNPAVQVVAIEPATSAVLSGGKAGVHGLQGLGAGFVPEILDTAIIDEVMPITDEAAYEAVSALARSEGVLAGISSGAALAAAVELAKRPESAGKTVVVLLPDTGERYLSTALFAEE
ncbi:MAG: cysteine synthase A [Eubacteriales bacterium]